MEEDVDVLRAQEFHEVLPPNALAPVATCAALEAVGQPERVVIMPLGAAGATAVIIVLLPHSGVSKMLYLHRPVAGKSTEI